MIKRKRKYNFRAAMNADYYGNEAVRTKFEFMFESFLKEGNVLYLVNQVFCFECNKFFPYEHHSIPEHCYYCKRSFIKADRFGEKGKLSRPDFILVDEDNKIKGIIRVDGIVHTIKKATRISDYFIHKAFVERDIKVFIITNDTLLKKSVKELRELVQEIKAMLDNETLYNAYINSKEYQELIYCPDIQIKKYNKK